MAITNSDISNVSKILTSKPAGSTGPAAAPNQLNTNVKPASTPSASSIEQKASQAAASVSGSGCGSNTTAKTECVKAIKEADDVVEALECVGAMYGIPSENIIRDDTLSSISVQGDTIIAPGVPTEGREAAIIRSISAVLDYISQRVDEKLDAYQGDNIEKGIIADHIRRDANPAKGNVINRLVDPDGNEVLVYDTGLVDMANTKTAQNFVNQMRDNGIIPKYNPTVVMGAATNGGYFTTEDDIMNGITSIQPQGGSDYGDSSTQPTQGGSDYSNTSTPPTQGGSDYGDSSASPAISTANDSSDDAMVNDMSQNVNESMDILNAVSVLQNTRHLGYDIFKSQGFDFVKPVDFFIESADGTKSKKKGITSQDIEHMKFDNTHLLKAVKYFNAARAEQSYVQGTHIDVQKLVDNPNWSKALYEIEKQFDCHLVVHYVKEENGRPNASTLMFDEASEYRQKCFISKSKGFQLGGLNVSVYIMNNFAGSSTPTDQSLFGQSITATILHEIFHNIMMVLRVYNVEFNSMMTTTMILASNTKNAKARRQLITNFANTIEKMGLVKFNIFEKQAYIKKLLLAVSMRDTRANMDLIEKMAMSSNDSKMIDEYLSSVERRQQREMDKMLNTKSKSPGIIIKSLIGLAVGISVAGAGLTTTKLPLVVVGGLLGLGSYGYLQYGLDKKAEEKKARRAATQDIENRKTGVTRNYEEYWCDMFAAMYNLPVSFFSIPGTKLTANNMTDEQIKRLHQIELNWVNLMNDPHPPTTERMVASVRYAQKTLDSGVKLAPEVKKYLEWIVENHKRLDEVLDVDKDYSKATFDPKTATNLDQHIQNLINKAGINLVESDLSFLFDNQFGEYIY